MLFKEKIMQLRKDRSISKGDFAIEAGIDRGLYYHIEAGERVPSRNNVIKIADALGCDRHELLTLWMADKIAELASREPDVAEESVMKALEKISKKKMGM